MSAELERRVLGYWTPDRMLRAAHPAPAERRVMSRQSSGALYAGAGTVSRSTGKVFFTLGGRDQICSGSTVRSANRDVVVTAGHCVKDGTGAWAENWIFVPGYQDGGGPYGGFTARRMFVSGRWSHRADDNFDVAMVALAPADGRHVTDAVGAPRIVFGWRRERRVHVFGYPAVGRYDGERLAYCAGRTRRDPHSSAGGQGLACDMTRGASGGPWLTRFDSATGTGLLVSISSFKYAGDSRTMYAPRFGLIARRLYLRAQRA
ncbi:hypothetical protein DPM19_25615 [Actinomadura craniellae]|uniref:Peptidase S1 domain-containing protein n=2 Tax=Actinomadura craniellae TaxID=2231787 RepID=A0A365H0E7_9ACTN|nr:hypothetical protein DPM19_25615 [Actinomadura craniellae]